MAKFEVKQTEFNLMPKNTKAFKEFIKTVPDTASYRIDTRDDGIFLNVYWINVNETDNDPVINDVYTIDMPHICVYGKLAYEIVTDLKPHDGIPFILNATDTIDLSKGFIDIMLRKIKEYQAPYIVVKGWIREHMQLLEEVNAKHMVVVRSFENDTLL